MGEISDALRRAMGDDGAFRAPRHAAEPRPAPAPVDVPTPPPIRALSPERTGVLASPEPPRALVRLNPSDRAIIFEDGQALEANRQLAIRVRAELTARRARSLAIVSGLQREGKTTVTCNLAIALASLARGRTVALVDLDIRRPSIAEVLDVRPRADIVEVLRGRADLEDACIQIEDPGLDVYPAIEVSRAAHEILVLPRFGEMFATLRERYDTVIVDTPPLLLVPDVNLILAHVETCIPIARMGQTRARAFRQLIGLLPPGRILGEILNGDRSKTASYEAYSYQNAKVEPPPGKQSRGRSRKGWRR